MVQLVYEERIEMKLGRAKGMSRVAVMTAAVVFTCQAAMPSRGAAQMNSGTQAGGPVELSKVLDGMLSGFQEEFMGVVNAMPADKFDFAPSQLIFVPGQKVAFDGVRTFGQECTHVATANYYIYSMVGGTKPAIDVKSLKNLKTKAEIVKALEDSFAFAHQAIATVTPDNAMNPIPGGDHPMTKATMAAYGVGHGFDHYGQMVEYLRMNGIVPPASVKK